MPVAEPSKILLTEGVPTRSEDLRSTETSEVEMTKSAPHISSHVRVKIVDAEVRFFETDPVQVELVIRGILPDRCQYIFYSIENRAGQNVKISLDGIHPANKSCEQTAQNFAYLLLLGRDMSEAGRGFPPDDYKLTVNNYQTSFSIKS